MQVNITLRLFDDSFFGSNLYISLVILLCGVSPLRVLVLRTSLVDDEPPRSNLRSHTGERAPRYTSLGYHVAKATYHSPKVNITLYGVKNIYHLLVAFFLYNARPKRAYHYFAERNNITLR